MLPARAGGPEDLHLDILGADIDLRSSISGSTATVAVEVDSAAGLIRHALHAMDAGLKFETREYAPSPSISKIRFLHAAELCLVVVE